MNKPMTAAEYAAHTESVKAKRPTETVTLKSGSRFELRRIDLSEMVELGIIPQTLVSESLKASKERDEYVPPNNPDANLDGLTLKREIVTACCVMPPFNEITARSFLKADYDEIFSWAMGYKGVEKAAALTSFRKGRKRRASSGRPDGEELQPETVSTHTN